MDRRILVNRQISNLVFFFFFDILICIIQYENCLDFACGFELAIIHNISDVNLFLQINKFSFGKGFSCFCIFCLFFGNKLFYCYKVTLATLLPATYQGHLDVTVWSPFLYGTLVPVAPYLSPALSQDLTAGMVLLNIKIDGWVRWKVGTWISSRYRLHVNCPAYITLAGHFSGDGPAVKYQLVQRCGVDV